MNRAVRQIVYGLIVAFALMLVVSGGALQGAGRPEHLTQLNTQGAMTVTVTLLTSERPRSDGTMAFHVRLATHAAVNLDQYPLESLAVVRDRHGRDIQALGLESLQGGSHHREGVLIFPGTDANGESLMSPQAKELTLILRAIGGVTERFFRWQLSGG